MARRLAPVGLGLFAAPAYLARRGTPRTAAFRYFLTEALGSKLLAAR